jgi:MATE family multidrug resistance protein
VQGAPIATSISRFVQLGVYVAVVVSLQHHYHRDGWGRWLARSKRCWGKACSMRVLGMFLQLAIPGGTQAVALEATPGVALPYRQIRPQGT